MTETLEAARRRPARPRTVPACWTWTQPTEESLRRVTEQLGREARRRGPESDFPDAESARWALMAKWQRDRCSICGHKPRKLLYDHDHWTNLFRGFLCTSCNTSEGVTENALLFVRYRERHPAIIFNIKLRQYTGWAPPYMPQAPKNPPHYG
jgi:hypothetical protein